MAYSNSARRAGAGRGGSTFLRGLMWAAIAIVVFLVAAAFDYTGSRPSPGRSTAVQLGLLVLTLAIGGGVGGASRWVSIGPSQFQFSEIAKILMIIVLANYLGAPEAGSARSGRSSAPGLLVGPPFVLVLLQPDLGTSLVFGAILAGMLFMSGASLRWLGVLAAGSWPWSRSSGRTSCATTRRRA